MQDLSEVPNTSTLSIFLILTMVFDAVTTSAKAPEAPDIGATCRWNEEIPRIVLEYTTTVT